MPDRIASIRGSSETSCSARKSSTHPWGTVLTAGLSDPTREGRKLDHGR
jgi:hypothetical protein